MPKINVKEAAWLNLNRRWPLLFSCLMHGLLLLGVLGLVNLSVSKTRQVDFQVPDKSIIHASVITENSLPQQKSYSLSQSVRAPQLAKIAALKAQSEREEQAKIQHLARQRAKEVALQQRRKEQARLAKEKAAQASLAKRKAQEFAQQKDVAKKKQALAAAAKHRIEQARQEAAHQASNYAASELQKYMALIRQAVSEHWIHSFSSGEGLRAEVLVRLSQQGQVLQASLIKSSGNSAYDRQALLAVQKASPLPLPQDSALKRKFSQFKLSFVGNSV